MSEDWRLHVELQTEAEARELADRLARFDLPHDLESSFHDRVVVSRDGTEVFCYTDTREQAEAAERAIQALASEHQWQMTLQLRHWHRTAEQWEDPDKPLPQSDAERAAEHAELMQSERQESLAQGYPDFEVRVKCPSRQDAEQLAARLRDEGIPSVHRWEFVVLGANDEDAANALAERVRSEAPPGSVVTAEASVAEVVAEAPGATPFSPFSVFGGLAG
jgi:hypothetical protein